MRFTNVCLVSLILVFLCPNVHAWGIDGHAAVCKIAQSRLSEGANAAVKDLLPDYAEGDLASVCSWADRVKFRYHWSSPLHYINVPDSACDFQYARDCKDEDGVKDRCVAGAINNYTSQLLTSKDILAAQSAQYNLTEALLFLSHLMGDIHQPLHVGHTSDKGGNTIDVHWYRRKTVLHHVWDGSIIETEEETSYDTQLDELVDALEHNITRKWADQVPEWESCSRDTTTCPNIYASESIKAACDIAYKGVDEDSTLEDEYFESRLPTVNIRLAQAGVRLAATLNNIFR
ncbi:endonuclease 2 [Silene latifolia]|uniref:endonuclease 2 n=1 Tax=Silene latifolia TaxID=37657 RepID=UPI003D77ED10